jgi:hypothetical protein
MAAARIARHVHFEGQEPEEEQLEDQVEDQVEDEDSEEDLVALVEDFELIERQLESQQTIDGYNLLKERLLKPLRYHSTVTCSPLSCLLGSEPHLTNAPPLDPGTE